MPAENLASIVSSIAVPPLSPQSPHEPTFCGISVRVLSVRLRAPSEKIVDAIHRLSVKELL